ncbi:MAG: CoA ester lyase, partial [Mycobacteriaceae bacterium]
VAPDAKVDARARVCAAASSGKYGQREVVIRVNSIGTQWHEDDLAAAAKAGPAAVLVPKINSASDVQSIERALEQGGAPEHTMIWAMLETPIAMLHAEEICGASKRLTVLVLGNNDLANELHAEHVPGRAPLLGGMSLALLAARATGKVILDGVYNDVSDLDGFTAECKQGRQLGFDGKTLIHPKQIEPCNTAFAPSEKEIASSQRIIEAFEEAQRAGRGVVTVDGRMIENLHVDNARRVLAVAAAIGALDQ